MKIKGNYDLKVFGINEIKNIKNKEIENKNPNLLELRYGEYKRYIFHKENSYNLVKSILGEEYLKIMQIDREIFDDAVNKHGYIYVLNNFLKGKGFVLVINKNFNHEKKDFIIGITNISKQGELFVEDDKDLFFDNVTYDEMFRYKKNNENTIIKIEGEQFSLER